MGLGGRAEKLLKMNALVAESAETAVGIQVHNDYSNSLLRLLLLPPNGPTNYCSFVL